MNQALRNAWMGIVALFLVLLGAASYVQVVNADKLNSHQANTRQLYQQFGSERGPILVAGEPIAESVPANSENFDYQRVYHNTHLYSGLTGFYSLSYGATGLENKMNGELSGTSDGMIVDRMMQTFTGAPMRGAQVELTLDPAMQELAYSKIPEGMNGSIVITEVETGNIKAMVSRPGYDTNLLAVHSGTEAKQNMEQIQGAGITPYRTLATQERSFPGSTFKIIDTIAMLESGQYEPDSTIDVPNQLDLPQTTATIRNFPGSPCERVNEQTLAWIFAQSCNTPFSQAAMDIGQEPILDVAERFGFNDSFEIPLTVDPSNFDSGELHPSTLAQSVLGQVNTQATALQMNMVAAGIANDGVVMKPQLIDSVRGPDLNLIDDPQPEVYNEAISPEIAAQMTDMMREVMVSGTGLAARGSTVPIAAKTGTATVGDGPDAKVNSWITGFAPADDPQYAVTLVYRNTDYSTGSGLTVNNMRQIMEAVVQQ